MCWRKRRPSGVGATLAVIRVAERGGAGLQARGVWAASPALRAELEGSRMAEEEIGTNELTESDDLPDALRRLARRWGAARILICPVSSEGRVLASLELARAGEPFSERDVLLARMIASHASLLVRAVEPVDGHSPATGREATIELAGRALAVAAEESRSAERIARLALEATGARSCVLWRSNGRPEPVASAGLAEDLVDLTSVVRDADELLSVTGSVALEGGLVLVRLGEPPLGGLRLVFDPATEPSAEELATLETFGFRAAHAVRAGERIERPDAGARAQPGAARGRRSGDRRALALAHARDGSRPGRRAAGDRPGRGLPPTGGRAGGGGRARARRPARPGRRGASRPRSSNRLRAQAGASRSADATSDPRLGSVRDAVSEAGIEAAVVVPLRAAGELIGLLVAYLPAKRRLGENESTLLAALAGQLAVAVQNAGLHEDTARLARERQEALDAERSRRKRLEAFYEISRSFSESLSLDETVDAIARTAVELLDVDAAVLRVPDERGDPLVPGAIHVPDARLGVALDPILRRPQPLDRIEAATPVVLDPATREATRRRPRAARPVPRAGLDGRRSSRSSRRARCWPR